MYNIRQIILTLLSLLVITPLFAQDMIVRRDGTIIQSKVMEVSSSEIKYKKASNPDGPLYTLKLSEILSINYQNGEVERYDNIKEDANVTSDPKGSPTEPRLIEVATASNNQALKDVYNNSKITPLKERAPSTKPIGIFFYKFAFTKNSVLSNEDIEIAFEWNETRMAFNWVVGHRDIKITNKSDQTIYIDKSKCFRVNLDGSSHIYHDGSKQMSVTNAGSTGLNVHLGAGVSIGGGKTRATTTTYTSEQILVIPPHSSAFLSTMIVEGKEFITRGEDYFFHGLGNIIPWEVKKWAIYDFTEEDTPGSIKYTFTYSKQEDFSTYSQANMELYIQQILGMGYTGGTLDVKYDPKTCIAGDSSK